MLERFNITQRIGAGLGVLLAILLALSAFTYASMTTIGAALEDYRYAQRQTTGLVDFFEDVAEMRLAAFKYRATAGEDAAAEVEDNAAELVEFGDAAPDLFAGRPEMTSNIAQLAADAVAYRAAFTEARQAGIEKRAAAAASVAAGESAQIALGRVRDEAERIGRADAAAAAGRVQEALMLSRFELERWLQTDEAAVLEEA
ncbi:MAG: hypothetical protein AAF192_08310, partial [Pseudomonadota bacterium]